MKEPIGYYIQDSPDGENAERIKVYGIIKMVHSEIWDGPIEYYQNHPNYIVTPIYGKIPDNE